MGRALNKPPAGVLLPFQKKWVEDTSPLKICEKARQTGLTWTSAFASVEACAVTGAKNDIWVTSRDTSLARQFINDCSEWITVLNLAVENFGEVVIQRIDGKSPITAQQIRFASGRSIYSLSSNPDAQAGHRGTRLLDEFALQQDPRKLYAIAEPGITWGGSIIVVSTHRGSQNFFNLLIKEIVEQNNPKGWSHHKITLQDALDQGLLYRLQEKLPQDHPTQEMDEQDYFEAVRARSPDAETFAQEYMCMPSDDFAAFLSYGLIDSCEYPYRTDWTTITKGRLFGGIDIGRTQDLTVLWVVEQLGDVFYTRHIECLQNMRKSEQEKILWPWIEKCDRTCIDKTGLGIGWVDDAEDEFGTKVEGITFTGPIKEKMAYSLRGRMEDRNLRIPPNDPLIRADLRKIKKTVTASGNIRFDSARDEDGHSDRFWALALAIEAGDGETCEYGYRPVTPKRDRDPTRMSDDDLEDDLPDVSGDNIGPVRGGFPTQSVY